MIQNGGSTRNPEANPEEPGSKFFGGKLDKLDPRFEFPNFYLLDRCNRVSLITMRARD